MNEEKLDIILKHIRADAPPALPPGFQGHVWREIHRRRRSAVESKSWWLEEVFALLLHPQTATAALIFSIGLGVGMGTISARTNEAGIASEVLEMKVFGSKPPGLPSTLLS